MLNRFKEFLVIVLVAMALCFISATPAFIQMIPAQSWLTGLIFFRIILVFLVLIAPLVILIRLALLKYKSSRLQKKHILLYIAPLMFLLSSIGILTYGILITYKAIKLEQAHNSAWLELLAAVGDEDFGIKYVECIQIINLEKKFTQDYLINNKIFDLATPILRFCSSGSFIKKSDENGNRRFTITYLPQS